MSDLGFNGRARIERSSGGASAAALLLAACVSSSVTLDATVSQERALELSLRNGSAQAIGYNLCASGLERRSEGRWQAVPTRRVCTMELRTLPPGGAARYQISLEDVPPGEYRARARIDGNPPEVATDPFIVR
jgi:hypothetical protein